eukprot:6178973-Pleurochrysis_carterae.AAC.3
MRRACSSQGNSTCACRSARSWLSTKTQRAARSGVGSCAKLVAECVLKRCKSVLSSLWPPACPAWRSARVKASARRPSEASASAGSVDASCCDTVVARAWREGGGSVRTGENGSRKRCVNASSASPLRRRHACAVPGWARVSSASRDVAAGGGGCMCGCTASGASQPS